jgi:hypothetical protein
VTLIAGTTLAGLAVPIAQTSQQGPRQCPATRRRDRSSKDSVFELFVFRFAERGFRWNDSRSPWRGPRSENGVCCTREEKKGEEALDSLLFAQWLPRPALQAKVSAVERGALGLRTREKKLVCVVSCACRRGGVKRCAWGLLQADVSSRIRLFVYCCAPSVIRCSDMYVPAASHFDSSAYSSTCLYTTAIGSLPASKLLHKFGVSGRQQEHGHHLLRRPQRRRDALLRKELRLLD